MKAKMFKVKSFKILGSGLKYAINIFFLKEYAINIFKTLVWEIVTPPNLFPKPCRKLNRGLQNIF